MLNALDVLIVGSFLAVIAVGFFSGVTKVTAAILAIYFSSIVSAAFYRPLANNIGHQVPSMATSTGHLFFFIVLFFIFAGVFTYFFSRWLGDLKLPKRFEILDNVGGAALGIAVSGLAVTLASMLLIVLIQAMNQTFGGSGNGSLVGMMHGQVSGSELVPVFLRAAPVLERTISPWFPRGLPPILSGRAET